MKPVTERFFHGEEGLNVEDIYREVYSLGKEQISVIKEELLSLTKKPPKVLRTPPERIRIFCRSSALSVFSASISISESR